MRPSDREPSGPPLLPLHGDCPVSFWTTNYDLLLERAHCDLKPSNILVAPHHGSARSRPSKPR